MVTTIGSSRGSSGWVKDMGTGNSGGHDQRDVGEVLPSFVAEYLGLRILLDIGIPRQGRVSVDAGTLFVIPDPPRDGLDCADDAIEFLKLRNISARWHKIEPGRRCTTFHLLRELLTVLTGPSLRSGAMWATAH